MFFKYGMNALQYGHHVAQNTTMVGLPCATAGKSTACPAKSCAFHGGALSPCSTANTEPAAANANMTAPSRASRRGACCIRRSYGQNVSPAIGKRNYRFCDARDSGIRSDGSNLLISSNLSFDNPVLRERLPQGPSPPASTYF